VLGAGGAQLTASRRRAEAERPVKPPGAGGLDGSTAVYCGRDVNAAKEDDDFAAADRTSVPKHAHGGFLGRLP
jgi:hypothetical protein